MTPVIFTGPPDPDCGNLPRLGDADKFYALRETPEGWLHGGAMILTYPRFGSYTVLHTSDDLAPWFAAGWRLTSF